MEAASFSSRRPAAGALPAFSLPPPNSDIPRASDGLSPSIASINTGSSQGSQAPAGMQYSYSGQVHGGAWQTPSTSSYTVSSTAQAQPSLGPQHFGGRSSIYSQPSNMQFSHPRTTQSPATGEGLPAPPYDQVHHPFQTPISGGGAGQTTPGGLSGAPHPPQSAVLSSQTTQPPTPSSASAHDAYTHTRPPSTPSYYTPSSTPQQPNFSSYAPQPSPTQHSPTTNGPMSRGLGSLAGQPQGPGMAPPASYRPYQPYQPLPTMGGSVMSNIHQPNGQMSMIPGGMVPPYGHHAMMYSGHGQTQPQSERPFKCDQCIQSFSRNHDLKRHKRIHLAVKPFPCTYCSKSFSRKDALKRHRLVKGCEGKAGDGSNGEANGDRSVDGDEGIDKKEV